MTSLLIGKPSSKIIFLGNLNMLGFDDLKTKNLKILDDMTRVVEQMSTKDNFTSLVQKDLKILITTYRILIRDCTSKDRMYFLMDLFHKTLYSKIDRRYSKQFDDQTVLNSSVKVGNPSGTVNLPTTKYFIRPILPSTDSKGSRSTDASSDLLSHLTVKGILEPMTCHALDGYLRKLAQIDKSLADNNQIETQGKRRFFIVPVDCENVKGMNNSDSARVNSLSNNKSERSTGDTSLRILTSTLYNLETEINRVLKSMAFIPENSDVSITLAPVGGDEYNLIIECDIEIVKKVNKSLNLQGSGNDIELFIGHFINKGLEDYFWLDYCNEGKAQKLSCRVDSSVCLNELNKDERNAVCRLGIPFNGTESYEYRTSLSEENTIDRSKDTPFTSLVQASLNDKLEYKEFCNNVEKALKYEDILSLVVNRFGEFSQVTNYCKRLFEESGKADFNIVKSVFVKYLLTFLNHKFKQESISYSELSRLVMKGRVHGIAIAFNQIKVINAASMLKGDFSIENNALELVKTFIKKYVEFKQLNNASFHSPFNQDQVNLYNWLMFIDPTDLKVGSSDVPLNVTLVVNGLDIGLAVVGNPAATKDNPLIKSIYSLNGKLLAASAGYESDQKYPISCFSRESLRTFIGRLTSFREQFHKVQVNNMMILFNEYINNIISSQQSTAEFFEILKFIKTKKDYQDINKKSRLHIIAGNIMSWNNRRDVNIDAICSIIIKHFDQIITSSTGLRADKIPTIAPEYISFSAYLIAFCKETGYISNAVIGLGRRLQEVIALNNKSLNRLSVK